jgi:hypothetical protein
MIPNFPELSLFDILNDDNLILFFELLVFLFVLHKIKTVNDNVNKGLENMKRIDEKFKKELYDFRKQSDSDNDNDDSTGYPVEYTDEMTEDTDKMTEEERTIRESCLKLPHLRAISFRKRMMLNKYFRNIK